ncbi:MAG: arginine--tRNA ligase [Bacteroidales bacterium]
MTVEEQLKSAVIKAISELYGQEPDIKQVQIQPTRKDFSGDYTLVVFPFLRLSKKKPEETAAEIGEFLITDLAIITDYNVLKGFLNLTLSHNFWLEFFAATFADDMWWKPQIDKSLKVMIEYSSPNTNKPLHLGHIRNNLLGFSVAQVVEAAGHEPVKVNLVNDRGIHICKSMLAWQLWGEGITPEKAGIKGDHLVGEFYVKFDKAYKEQVKSLMAEGATEEEAKRNAPLILDAQEMLKKWEAGDQEIVALWRKMNDWVLAGFDETYRRMGVDFDKIYYESQTYKLGKSSVLEGVEKGVFYTREDGSIWADLTKDGLDEKLLLRKDGTSVYMTQDIGTARQRMDEYQANKMVYVVGNEQNYHFQVLRLLMSKLGFQWANNIYHLSYGMVELPEGKMKSREGTVVDADDLIDGMIQTAREMSEELGKLEGYSKAEKDEIFRKIGLGALKYFILKVDPKKNMTFNPKESIDFNGNTGPFIQYTYARVQSLKRKGLEKGLTINYELIPVDLAEKELRVVKNLYQYTQALSEAANEYSPAVIANYVYELAKEYNQFYQEHPILIEENVAKAQFRFALSHRVGETIAHALNLLGIEVPERM